MNILDISLVVIMFAVIGIQTFRGFGRALFDGLMLYGALFLAGFGAVALSHSVRVTDDAGPNLAFWFVTLFLVLGVLAFVISRYIYGSILLNLGMFDHLAGLVAGCACALILAHGIVQSIEFDSNGSGEPSIVASSNVGSECLTFHSYHNFVDTLYTLTAGHDTKVD